MPSITTYSFADLSGAIAHDALGAYTFTGEGVGEVNIAMSTEKTSHDIASDGAVMVSKIEGHNGTITIHVQQTSTLHKWLLAAYNYVNNAPINEWAKFASFLRNVADGSSHTAVGISFQKIGDKPYQAQGQRVTWVLMAADIQSVSA